jgi:competence protein ComGC
MDELSRPPDQQPGRRSRTLVLFMLVIIVVSILAFLVFHPDPSGAGHTDPTQQR